MTLFKKSYNQLIKEAVDILLRVKDNIKDGSDCIWTYYETPEQMRNEIDKYVLELEKGSTSFLDEMNVHFSVTAAYQEHAMSNDWHNEYLKLAERFDKIYEDIKSYK